MDAAKRAALHRLLNDVVQSEHRLRHPNAFEALCADLGFYTRHAPGGSEVHHPDTDEEERLAAEAAVVANRQRTRALSAPATVGADNLELKTARVKPKPAATVE